MKCFFRLLSAFLLVGLFGVDAFANIPKILLLKDLKPGTRAIGFSVFKGVEPQPFDVLIGNTTNFMGGSLILSRVSGGPMETLLEEIGAISGMSGSPVFIDCINKKLSEEAQLEYCISSGTLVGSTSYGPGSFVKGGPNFLLTPAEYMLGTRFGGYMAAAQFLNHMPDKIVVGGMEFINLLLFPKMENLAGPGGSIGMCSEHANSELKAGSMVTVFLAKGTIPFGASGTVTWRDGNEIYIFGHPFMGTGIVDYPFIHVAVADTIQTPSGAFKLPGCYLKTEGSVVVDGAFEMAGIIGRTAPTIPLKVELHLNNSSAVFEEEIVPSPKMGEIIKQLPALWAGQLLGDLNSLSIAYQVRMVIKDSPEIFIKNIALAQVEENPFAKLFGKINATLQRLYVLGVSGYGVEKIDVHVDFINNPSVWVKKTAFLSQKEAVPGETIYANVVLEDLSSGSIQQMSFPIRVPLDFKDRLGMGASGIDILIQDGGKFTSKKDLTGRSSVGNFIGQLNQAMNYKTDVLYIQQIMPRLKSDDEIDNANAKTSVKPAWKWTELQEGDLRLFPNDDKSEIVLTLSPELSGFIDFEATLSLVVQDKEKETVVLENKETKKWD